jgi:ribosomal protein S18 acetylase RimI-like enzyme
MLRLAARVRSRRFVRESARICPFPTARPTPEDSVVLSAVVVPGTVDAPKKLVVRGLYRYTRNPMYVGVLAVILGWVLVFRAVSLSGYAAFVGFCFHLFVVLYEERHLHQTFADDYDAYCTRVGRWLQRSGQLPRTLHRRQVAMSQAEDIRYEPFQEAHVGSVVELCRELSWKSYSDAPTSLRVLSAPGAVTWVAHHGETVVGLAHLLTDGLIQAHLSLVGVLPAYRRQGVARNLLREAFRAGGSKWLDLQTELGSEDFYRSFRHQESVGFRIYPDEPDK